MQRWTTRKRSLTAVCALALVLAAAFSAGAAAPWFGPGGSGQGGQGRSGQSQRRVQYGEARFIRLLYQGFLNREPTPDEVRNWGAKMSRGASPAELVRTFMDSDEYFIRQTYRGLLGREADPSGMSTFTRGLQRGQSRSDVVESILESEEFFKRLR